MATTIPSFLEDDWSGALGRGLRRVLGSPWLRPLNDVSAIDDLLQSVDPLWSLTRIRARVVRVKREAPGVTTLVLQASRLWPGHVAGQHVTVDVDVDGRRLRRTFSVASAPGSDGLVHITVKQREGGPVSRWWNTRAGVGDVLTLSAPSGDFVLPRELPPRIVMLAAGSGITPLMAMLRDLRRRRERCEVTLLHVARTSQDRIFADEIDAMAGEGSWLRVRSRFTASDGRPETAELAALASESGDAPVFACGPAGFLDAVRDAWASAGLATRLHVESFGAPRAALATGHEATSVEAARSGRTFVALPGQTLLEAAEAAGLRPAHGCRAGICQECRCRKLGGVAVDVRDGRVLAEAGESIQLCVTAARGPVTLEL